MTASKQHRRWHRVHSTRPCENLPDVYPQYPSPPMPPPTSPSSATGRRSLFMLNTPTISHYVLQHQQQQHQPLHAPTKIIPLTRRHWSFTGPQREAWVNRRRTPSDCSLPPAAGRAVSAANSQALSQCLSATTAAQSANQCMDMVVRQRTPCTPVTNCTTTAALPSTPSGYNVWNSYSSQPPSTAPLPNRQYVIAPQFLILPRNTQSMRFATDPRSQHTLKTLLLPRKLIQQSSPSVIPPTTVSSSCLHTTLPRTPDCLSSVSSESLNRYFPCWPPRWPPHVRSFSHSPTSGGSGKCTPLRMSHSHTDVGQLSRSATPMRSVPVFCGLMHPCGVPSTKCTEGSSTLYSHSHPSMKMVPRTTSSSHTATSNTASREDVTGATMVKVSATCPELRPPFASLENLEIGDSWGRSSSKSNRNGVDSRQIRTPCYGTDSQSTSRTTTPSQITSVPTSATTGTNQDECSPESPPEETPCYPFRRPCFRPRMGPFFHPCGMQRPCFMPRRQPFFHQGGSQLPCFRPKMQPLFQFEGAQQPCFRPGVQPCFEQNGTTQPPPLPPQPQPPPPPPPPCFAPSAPCMQMQPSFEHMDPPSPPCFQPQQMQMQPSPCFEQMQSGAQERRLVPYKRPCNAPCNPPSPCFFPCNAVCSAPCMRPCNVPSMRPCNVPCNIPCNIPCNVPCGFWVKVPRNRPCWGPHPGYQTSKLTCPQFIFRGGQYYKETDMHRLNGLQDLTDFVNGPDPISRKMCFTPSCPSLPTWGRGTCKCGCYTCKNNWLPCERRNGLDPEDQIPCTHTCQGGENWKPLVGSSFPSWNNPCKCLRPSSSDSALMFLHSGALGPPLHLENRAGQRGPCGTKIPKESIHQCRQCTNAGVRDDETYWNSTAHAQGIMPHLGGQDLQPFPCTDTYDHIHPERYILGSKMLKDIDVMRNNGLQDESKFCDPAFITGDMEEIPCFPTLPYGNNEWPFISGCAMIEPSETESVQSLDSSIYPVPCPYDSCQLDWSSNDFQGQPCHLQPPPLWPCWDTLFNGMWRKPPSRVRTTKTSMKTTQTRSQKRTPSDGMIYQSTPFQGFNQNFSAQVIPLDDLPFQDFGQDFSSPCMPSQDYNDQEVPGNDFPCQITPEQLNQSFQCQDIPDQITPGNDFPYQGTNQSFPCQAIPNQGICNQIPWEGTFAQGMPGQGIPWEGMSGHGMSGQEMSEQRMPRQKMPRQKMSRQKMSRQEMPGQMMSGQEMSGQRMSGQEMSGQRMSGQRMSGQRMSGQEMSGQRMSGQRMSGQEMSIQEMPGQEMPGQEMPGQDIPRQEMPGKKMTGQGMPGPEMSGHWMPGHGFPCHGFHGFHDQDISRHSLPGKVNNGEWNFGKGLWNMGSKKVSRRGRRFKGFRMPCSTPWGSQWPCCTVWNPQSSSYPPPMWLPCGNPYCTTARARAGSTLYSPRDLQGRRSKCLPSSSNPQTPDTYTDTKTRSNGQSLDTPRFDFRFRSADDSTPVATVTFDGSTSPTTTHQDYTHQDQSRDISSYPSNYNPCDYSTMYSSNATSLQNKRSKYNKMKSCRSSKSRTTGSQFDNNTTTRSRQTTSTPRRICPGNRSRPPQQRQYVHRQPRRDSPRVAPAYATSTSTSLCFLPSSWNSGTNGSRRTWANQWRVPASIGANLSDTPSTPLSPTNITHRVRRAPPPPHGISSDVSSPPSAEGPSSACPFRRSMRHGPPRGFWVGRETTKATALQLREEVVVRPHKQRSRFSITSYDSQN